MDGQHNFTKITCVKKKKHNVNSEQIFDKSESQWVLFRTLFVAKLFPILQQVDLQSLSTIALIF